jgi:hypothetical protein
MEKEKVVVAMSNDPELEITSYLDSDCKSSEIVIYSN